jgi:tRNA/tmRNA/rRNA uracil-C5-methylase (TrmA/RlmC/RlmD family)
MYPDIPDVKIPHFLYKANEVFYQDDLTRLEKRKPKLVLDCYAGSGTTLAACKKRGIKSIGVEEIDEYLIGAKQRLSQQSLMGE